MKRWIHATDYTIPDKTERFPEGMTSWVDDSHWTTDFNPEERLIDVVTDIKYDMDETGNFYKRVEVYNSSLDHIAEWVSLEDLLYAMSHNKQLANKIVKDHECVDGVIRFIV